MFHFMKLLYYTPYTQIKHLRILTVMPYFHGIKQRAKTEI